MTHHHDPAPDHTAERAPEPAVEPGQGHAPERGHEPGEPRHGHGHGWGGDLSELIELLTLDAEVFDGYLREATALVRETMGGTEARRIADLGCGPGGGTLALAREFPRADLYAVDAAQPLLDHLVTAARTRGVADRVHPLTADLDHEWPEPVRDLDLVWASVSVHHLADPEGGLAAIASVLSPGGWVALVEVDDLLRFHPTFLPGRQDGAEGLESRARAVLVPDMTAAMPYLGADWGALLAAAGFTVVVDRVFDLALRPPLPTATNRYAQVVLRRLRAHLEEYGEEGRISAEDLAALDVLIGDGPGGVLHRSDLLPRARRHLWVARRGVAATAV